MNTTSLIVEIVVGGFVALIWVVLIIAKIYNVAPFTIGTIIIQYKDFSSYILFATMAFSYQLGWLMIHISYIATKNILIIPVRKKIFNDKYENYREIKNMVYFNSKDELMAGIEKDRSVIRLSRIGLLNFFILSLVLVLYQLWWVALVCIVISILSTLQLRAVYLSLYQKINDSYTEIIQRNKDKDNPV